MQRTEQRRQTRQQEFIEQHIDQVVTALQHMVDFWTEQATTTEDPAHRAVSEGAAGRWQQVLDKAEKIEED